jgi:predicted permease
VSNEISRQPGIVAVGIGTNVPLSGDSGKSAATVEGYMLRPGESPRGHYSYGVDGEYFRAMGISLVAGRFLTAADSRRSERVCVVDEQFARHYWPDLSALGRRLWQGFHPAGRAGGSEAFTVVGVVRSVKQAGLTEEAVPGAVYYPYRHRPERNAFIAVRTVLPSESSAAALQKMVRQIDPDLPVNDVRTMETRISGSLVTRRAPALLAGLFAAVAVLLTAIGTYGVLSYSVAQRRREIGVRMALGARPEQIRRQFLALALRLLLPGAAIGLMGAVLAGRAMRTILFQVAAFNVPVLAGAACVMAVVALLACLLPSWRASRVSPVEALADQ